MGFYRSIPVDMAPSSSTTNGYFYSSKQVEKLLDATLITFTINSYTPCYYVKDFNIIFDSPSSINANCTNITLEGPAVYFDNSNVNSPRLIVNPKAQHIYLSSCDNLFRNCNNIVDWSFLDYLNTKYCTNYSNMFYYCTRFNRPVTIGESAINCNGMFASCWNFNQPVTIPDGVTDLSGMFAACAIFNQPIVIPNSVTSCVKMFSSCDDFNQPITIPNSVTNCRNMFYGCNNFSQSMTVPDSVTDCYRMFVDCENFSKNIYFKGNKYREVNVVQCVMRYYNYYRVNIFFNSVFNNKFNANRSSNSIAGDDVTWTTMTNGFYNDTYNIYCYYNYAG